MTKINILEDPKISADGNSAKSAALDHLGSIGAIVYGKIAESEKMAQLNVPEGNALLPLSAVRQIYPIHMRSLIHDHPRF